MNDIRVEVEWLDSGLQNTGGWKNKEEVKEFTLSTVQTSGYLVHEDKETLYIALTKDSTNSHYYGIQLIAKSNIKKMKRLRER